MGAVKVVIKISIHALRVEGDIKKEIDALAVRIFLSTPSGWRATAGKTHICTAIVDFYPRPPGGGRQCYHIVTKQTKSISIHALRVEGDLITYR